MPLHRNWRAVIRQCMSRSCSSRGSVCATWKSETRVGRGLRTAGLESLNVLKKIFIQREVKVGCRLRLMCLENSCDSAIYQRMAILFRAEHRRNANTPLIDGTPLGLVNG